MKKGLAAFWFAVILITLILCVRCAVVQAQTVAISTDTAPSVNNDKHSILIRGKIAGDWKQWLVIETHNGYQWKDNGYDPSLTRLVVDYMPLFRKLPNGQYEIMFTSPIAKNIP